jgi:hypothetical protein
MVNIALFSWPFCSAVLFRLLDLRVAIALTVIVGYLLLPPAVGIDLPLLPPIEKDTVAAISALVLAVIFAGKVRSLPGWLPRSRTALVLILLLVVGAFLTTLTNGDRLAIGPRILPALRLYDAFAITQSSLVALIPFFLGRKFFAGRDQHRILLLVLCLAGLAYSILALYEIRMSPQLNRYLYGYFPHDWRQHLRGGGYRPVVFLEHGLRLGIFICCAMLAAAVCYRGKVGPAPWRFLVAAIWLLMTLVLAKTLGAIMIALILLPAVLFLNVRLQLLTAGALGLTILLYPMLRGADLVPVDRIVSFAEGIDQQRAGSLQYRLDHENMLLARANERPLFGWGGYNRGRVFDDRGRNISTTDGSWIISVGQGGWLRYIGEFGLLTLSMVLLAFRKRSLNVSLITSGLSLVLAANLIDLVPNSGLSPVTWLMAGALYGRLELANDEVPNPASQEWRERVRVEPPSTPAPPSGSKEADAGAPVSAYTRQTIHHRRRQGAIVRGEP